MMPEAVSSHRCWLRQTHSERGYHQHGGARQLDRRQLGRTSLSCLRGTSEFGREAFVLAAESRSSSCLLSRSTVAVSFAIVSFSFAMSGAGVVVSAEPVVVGAESGVVGAEPVVVGAGPGVVVGGGIGAGGRAGS
jgi:hypothetical protein